MRRVPLAAPALVVLGALVALAGGCGGDGDGPGAKREPFPKPAGRSLAQVLGQGRRGDAVLAPGVGVLRPGKNRFGFGLFTLERESLDGVDSVAVYVARGANGRVRGPVPVRIGSLKTAARFRARAAAADTAVAGVVYAAEVELPGTGEYRLGALIRRNGELFAADQVAVVVKRWPGIPKPGDRAPRVSTPTVASVGGQVSKIETRDPPDTMHRVNLADVLGKKPVVLLFATPRLCQSRVCGPVVDIAEQVKARYGDRAAFIHMEVYRDNRVERGLRPQLAAYGLQSEPYLFVIDRHGRVSTAIEGAFSARELAQALAKVITP